MMLKSENVLIANHLDQSICLPNQEQVFFNVQWLLPNINQHIGQKMLSQSQFSFKKP
jgi:hypothetical protein